MLLTAAQHAYDPAEQDDGYGHAYEAGSHPLQVCRGTREVAVFVGAMPSSSIVISSDYEKSILGTHGARATHPALSSSSDWLAGFWGALMMSSSILLVHSAEPILWM